MDKELWQLDLSEYIKQGEPSRIEKSVAWQAAIGLQDVDGLKVSNYLVETAKEHIEGNIDIHAAQKRIESYYEAQQQRTAIEQGTQEADIVSSRIAELLSEYTFQFSPAEWQLIHKKLFTGLFKHAGNFRNYNITKKEWVLKGNTVAYADYDSIMPLLKYDFSEEKSFSYVGLSIHEAIKHLAKFVAGIWQIHPFAEGNTRATAVFFLKYLQSYGFQVNNSVFAENSWYFRNALVRANYTDLQNEVYETTEFLEMFLENLLLSKHNELKNRYLHLDYIPTKETLKRQNAIPKRQNGVLECDLEALALLKIIAEQPKINQRELAEVLHKPYRTVQRIMQVLQAKGYLRRQGGKRFGEWLVLVDIKSI